MDSQIFNSVLKSIAIPIVALYFLSSSGFDFSLIFLAVAITLTIVNALTVLFSIIKILPNTLLLKSKRVSQLMVGIIIDLLSVIGFWYYYFVYVR